MWLSGGALARHGEALGPILTLYERLHTQCDVLWLTLGLCCTRAS